MVHRNLLLPLGKTNIVPQDTSSEESDSESDSEELPMDPVVAMEEEMIQQEPDTDTLVEEAPADSTEEPTSGLTVAPAMEEQASDPELEKQPQDTGEQLDASTQNVEIIEAPNPRISNRKGMKPKWMDDKTWDTTIHSIHYV